MADKIDKLVVEALRKSAVERGGVAPFVVRGELGLFPASPLGRQAAERATSNGLFNTDGELWTHTEAGFAMLLERTSPRQVLEDCVRALEARQDQLDELKSTVSDMSAGLAGLRSTIEQTLPTMRGGKSQAPSDTACDSIILDAMSRWQADAGEDCPLPELYRQVELTEPNLTIGAFHDAIRRLQSAGRLYLHPWTGPLYRMPEPSYALMSGHEIAYYASGRAAHPDYSTDDALAAPGRA